MGSALSPPAGWLTPARRFWTVTAQKNMRADAGFRGFPPAGRARSIARLAPRTHNEETAMRCLKWWLAALWLSAVPAAFAQDDFWARKTLLDSPGGPKQALAAQGVDLSFDVTNFLQGLQNGDKDLANGTKYDLRFRLDGEKLGLWPGFFVSSHVEYNRGTDVNQSAPGLNIIAVNTALGYPSLNDSMFSLLFTQAFSPTTTLTLGLFNMFDAAARRPLVGGGGVEGFWNLAIAAPLTNITPPYIYGISFNTRNDLGSFGLFVYDPRDAQNLNIVRGLFEDGVTISGTASFPVTIAGLGGFQNLRIAYSTLDGTDLSSLPPQIGGQPAAIKENRWYFQYSFEQFLVQSAADPKVGWGLFGQFGYSDGNPNAFQGHGYIGLAGNNMMAGRQADRWGIGYYRYKLSDAFLNVFPVLGSRLDPQKGAEVFYNWAVTPWLRVQADGQWVAPFNAVDDNYYLGLSLQFKVF
jgi:porin